MQAKAYVRLAVAEDAAAIRNVARHTWNDAYAEIILPENQECLLGRWHSPVTLEKAIGQSESWFHVAVVQGEVIGFAQFLMRENKRAEPTRIYVLPEWQRQGIGSGLLREGLAALSMHGAEEVLVHIEKGNARGIEFYEHRGFQRLRVFSVGLPEQNLELLEYASSLGQGWVPPNNVL